MTPAEQHARLLDAYLYHRYLYYKCNTSEISDYEYDMLEKQLERLEGEYPELHSGELEKIGWPLGQVYTRKFPPEN